MHHYGMEWRYVEVVLNKTSKATWDGLLCSTLFYRIGLKTLSTNEMQNWSKLFISVFSFPFFELNLDFSNLNMSNIVTSEPTMITLCSYN